MPSVSTKFNYQEIYKFMKKRQTNDNPVFFRWVRKGLLIMRLSLLLIVLGVLQSAASVYAQNWRFSLNEKNISIKEVLVRIEHQSEFRFFYEEEKLNVDNKFNVKIENSTITEVLDQLFKEAGVEYKVLDNNFIVLKPAEKEANLWSGSQQQQKTISGKVTDSSGLPLPGVTVVIKGTAQGTITDSDGNYSLSNVPADATLVFSFVGMKSQEIAAAGKTSINVTLEGKTIGIEEVVAIGYGTMRKTELTSAVTSVKADDFVKGAITDVAQLIQGKVAGLSIVKTNANPTEGSQITLRGAITLAAGTQPLIVIDGVPGSLNDVAPEDIESIDILKDGSAAAIYGTRGSNGVFLITTKKVKGVVKEAVEINSYVSTQIIAKKLDFMDAAQYRKFVAQGKPGAIDYGGNTDWLDEVTQTPISHVENVSIKGGKSNSNYIVNLNYKSLEGIMKKSDNKTFTTRLAINHTMFDNKVRINASIMGREQKYFAAGDGYSYRGDIYRNALIYNPTDPIADENGVWTEHPSMNNYRNPAALVEEVRGENKGTNLKTFGTISYTPIDNLTFKLLISHNSWNQIKGYSETNQHYSTVANNRNGFASRGTDKSRDDLLDFTIRFSKTIKNHNFTLLGGYSWQERNWEGFWANNWDFPSDIYSYNKLSAGTAISRGQANMDSWQGESKLLGYFARLNYNYKDKYLLMASIRHEGSSKFGENHKWGNFPAISAGWNIKNEPFMKNITLLNTLKVRAGFGITGTEPASSYMSLSRLATGRKYYNNGEWIPVIQPQSNANPDLRWEKKEEINIGLDFALLKNRLGGSVDVYKRTTKDMLWNYNVPTPPYLYGTILANAGTMENKGIEAQIYFFPVQRKRLTWKSTINISSNKNTLVSLSNDEFINKSGYFYTGYTGEPIQQNTHRIEEGGAIGNFWGYKSIDIDEDGYWIIEGQDGQPKSIYDQQPDDKQVLGNGIPNIFASWDNIVNYKNFDLAVTMRGAFGYDILNFTSMFFGVPVSLTRGNVLSNTFDNIYGKRPLNDQQDLQYVSYYVEKGDFWKIDNVTFGYTYKVSNSYIKSLRVYASAGNLFTFTSYSGIDPEVNVLGLEPGIDYRDRYPSTRNYTLGVSLKF